MNYEEEYNAIVQRCRELHESGNALTKQQMEIVCPQLAESEDERIKKWLIAVIEEIKADDDWCADLNKCDEAIAWLEKQKEQKPAEWSKYEIPIWKLRKGIKGPICCTPRTIGFTLVVGGYEIDINDLLDKLPKEK